MPSLCLETGWSLALPSAYPALRELSLVQRFSSGGGWVNAVTLDEDGLSCTCLGWRRGGACWHVRFVLRWNIRSGEVGRYLYRLPDDEDAEWCLRNSWAAWLEDHVALVPPRRADRRGSAPRLTPPSIRS